MRMPLSYLVGSKACGSCHYVIGEGSSAGPKTSCPHCGYQDFPFAFPHETSLDVLDLLDYFYKQAKARIRKRNKKLSENFKEQFGKSFDISLLVNTALKAKEVYDDAGESQWTSEIEDQMINIIQEDLGLSTQLEAQKAWDELSRYSSIVQEHKVVVILACTFLEQILDGRLIILAVSRGGMGFEEAEKKVYDESHGWMKKVDFFQKSTKIALKEAIIHCSSPRFYEDWETLRKVRNTFIHENVGSISAAHADQAWKIAKEATAVFAKLQNMYCVK